MADAESSMRPKLSGGVVAILGIVIPVSLFLALKLLREPRIFINYSISVQGGQEEFEARLAELRREESAVILRAHTELIALTLLALILLYFLFSRSGTPKWTRYLLIAAAAASITASWLQW